MPDGHSTRWGDSDIERAAHAILHAEHPEASGWSGKPTEVKDRYRAMARAALDAIPPDGTCDDCVGVAEFMPEYSADDLPDAARHIAFGVDAGGWCCDHVEWDQQDATMAYQALWARDVRRRDRLREALDRIGEHARLDETERGSGEASRYYVIAEDAVAKAGLPPAHYLAHAGQDGGAS